MPESKRRPPAVPKSSAPPPPSKRRVVNLADDADLVLAQCRRLRDALRRKQAFHAADDDDDYDYEDDEWGLDDDSRDGGGGGKKWKKKKTEKKKKSVGGAAVKTDVDAEEGDAEGGANKTVMLSLSELKGTTNASGYVKKSIVEVVEMNSTEVMEGIENVAVTIATQVLARRGFQLDIPCELNFFVCVLRSSEYVGRRGE